MQSKSRTSLVLMELIITVLFFSLASTVCVQLFVNSHLTTKETKKLNKAVSISQSIAEVMRGTDGSLDSIMAYFPTATGDDDYFVIYYDDNFTLIDDVDNAKYAADVSVSSIGNLYNMDITFVDLSDFNEIYSLSTSKYIR